MSLRKLICFISVSAALCLISVAPALGQDAARLRLDGLTHLDSKASNSVDVSIDGKLLQIALRFVDKAAADDDDKDLASIRELVTGLKGIYVRSFEFDGPDGYAPADLEQLRSQLRSGSWQRMVGVTSRKEGENVEVFTNLNGDIVGGLAVIAANAKSLTVVNIVGPVDIDKLMALQARGQFNLPKLQINIKKKP